MLNEEKIQLMTKLAIYEQREGKKEIPMSKYFKSDYVSINMVKTVIAATINYFLIVLIWLLYDLEGFLNNLTNINLLDIGKIILVLYIGFILLYMVIAYVVYNYKFRQVRESLKLYNAGLKQINKIQEEEGKIKEQIEMGGNDEYDESFSN